MTRTVAVIGAGRIGRQVIAFIEAAPGLSLGRVLTTSGIPDTGDAATFFAAPADIVIDAAGPAALRQYGPQALSQSDLWTVGAVALADDAFRAQMIAIGDRHATALRLFSPWISGVGDGVPGPDDRLSIHAQRPGLGERWSGPLRDSLARFPDDLNFAVAAALCGPGIEATTIDLSDPGPDGPHRIDATLVCAAGHFTTSAQFDAHDTGMHPTAAAIIGALRNERQPLRYG